MSSHTFLDYKDYTPQSSGMSANYHDGIQHEVLPVRLADMEKEPGASAAADEAERACILSQAGKDARYAP